MSYLVDFMSLNSALNFRIQQSDQSFAKTNDAPFCGSQRKQNNNCNQND